jgi:hypothetical protein
MMDAGQKSHSIAAELVRSGHSESMAGSVPAPPTGLGT